jgi:hypothetical protein
VENREKGKGKREKVKREKGKGKREKVLQGMPCKTKNIRPKTSDQRP